MMYDSEGSGRGVTPHGGGESQGGVSAEQPFFFFFFFVTLTALKSAKEDEGCSPNHQGANVVVRLEHLPVISSVARHELMHTDRNSRS